MTTQTKHFIETADIVALRCECKNEKCRATLTIPIRGITGRSMATCPHCNSDWMQEELRDYTEISKFTSALIQLMNAQKNYGFSLMLEIKPDAMPKQGQ